MNLNQLDIIVSDVTQVCASLERIWIRRQTMPMVSLSSRLAVTVSCYLKIILVSFGKLSVRIILHIEVEDVTNG